MNSVSVAFYRTRRPERAHPCATSVSCNACCRFAQSAAFVKCSTCSTPFTSTNRRSYSPVAREAAVLAAFRLEAASPLRRSGES